jgi:hypothetical protein
MPTETEHARRLRITRAACDHVTLIRQSTRIARHRSYIKLKFIKNFCLSCKTLANQVARNPGYHCTSLGAKSIYIDEIVGDHQWDFNITDQLLIEFFCICQVLEKGGV